MQVLKSQEVFFTLGSHTVFKVYYFFLLNVKQLLSLKEKQLAFFRCGANQTLMICVLQHYYSDGEVVDT